MDNLNPITVYKKMKRLSPKRFGLINHSRYNYFQVGDTAKQKIKAKKQYDLGQD